MAAPSAILFRPVSTTGVRRGRAGPRTISFCYAPAMRCSVAIVGTGRLGSALALRLRQAGYRVEKISRQSRRASAPSADLVWFCVPDSKIASVAGSFARFDWHGKLAFHSSGVLASDTLSCLRAAGARVASVHPLMTFVKRSRPELKGVPFAIEGDRAAVRIARAVARDLGGEAFALRKQEKIAYHAFATLVCPLLVSLLRTSEEVAALAGISEREARRRMMPIVRQTISNYEKLGAAGAFSGPIVRGDLETLRAHLGLLRRAPVARKVYLALAQSALRSLPHGNSRQMARLLANSSPAARRR
jgi:predicted short-subunit dehydrogenase-like oxidoreductase (DUF2520 family)